MALPFDRQGLSTGPFAVTRGMVAALGDEALRDLLGKLIEAEAAARGIPFAGIDLGGHQDAPDGGVDAVLRWSGAPEPRGWVPRRLCIFQSKAQAMPPAAIAREMRPRGSPRPIFDELAAVGGAYILFSSADAGFRAVENRRKAMREALAGVKSAERIALDFLAADRIARWVNQHNGVAMWLLDRSGRALAGWRPYAPWSAPDVGREPYLADDETRAETNGATGDIYLAVSAIRTELAQPRRVVRLIGRSGMGKTRLAEALFDPDVPGGVPLPPHFAVYGDLGREIAASTSLVAEKLVLAGTDAVLVVDNCPAVLHSRLAEIVRRPGSATRLLSIDYDMADDPADGALIVRLEPSSDALIDALLKRRLPQLSAAARARLTGFAGGNARVALAIANSAGDGADLAPLNDRELVDRLFQTGRRDESDVRLAAGAASLVIAFYAERWGEHAAEYRHLAKLAGLAPERFFRAINAMLEWGIAQQRGPQRAVKPDAIANHLAAQFLAGSDSAALIDIFANGPERLLASFARRLGQIANVKPARDLAERLLAADGCLSKPGRSYSDRHKAFEAIIPAAPQAALRAAERELDGIPALSIRHSSPDYAALIELVGLIASLPETFRAGMLTLTHFATLEDPESQGICRARFEFLSKYNSDLKFSHAPEAMHREFLEGLLQAEDSRLRELGLEALGQTLPGSMHKSGNAVPADNPVVASRESFAHEEWGQASLNRLVEFALSEDPLSDCARNLIADGLVPRSPDAVEVIAAMKKVRPQGYWHAGWVASGRACNAVGRGGPDGLREDLSQLYRELTPRSFEACFEAFVLGSQTDHARPGRRDWKFRSSALLARAVGRAAVRAGQQIEVLAARAVRANTVESVFAFGAGLARSAESLDSLWTIAKRALRQAEPDKRSPSLLIGIIHEANRFPKPGWRAWTDRVLDEIEKDPLLRPWIGAFHQGRRLVPADLARLSRALDRPSPNLRATLAPLHPMEGEADQQAMARLLDKAMTVDGDGAILLRIMERHIGAFGRADAFSSPDLLETAKALLVHRNCYLSPVERADSMLAGLARAVFALDPSDDLATEICRCVRQTRWVSWDSDRGHWGMVAALMECRPQATLDCLVGESATSEEDDLSYFVLGSRFDNDFDRNRSKGPPSHEKELLRWASRNPQIRSLRLAEHIRYCTPPDDSDPDSAEWTGLALELLKAAPDPISVLETFERRMARPDGGTSFFHYLRRHSLLLALKSHGDPVVRRWGEQAVMRMERRLAEAEGERDEEVFE
ncbi:MAG TPA: hypothetical protein VF645_00010 [Allosphingosinicella sp.]